ncbi:hypothetical protein UFOVP1413_10 [uncultured Caudovirales phage]|uniref:Uncharacterized protein n=1 Tax=uncultured Caudovirales phage TaxID=2100421 RepID=A0A6J5PIK4_9CAUD|nr:hypothetical protein UFOVP893_29 [uncultured Caudovirales phage]CAB4210340.1 hypothetical protein UFOVP1413_10 [uncultured Caudovirales phage]
MGFSVKRIAVIDARNFIAKHHSRLPYTQKGPWKIAYGVFNFDALVGVALWHNCSARGLPQNWLELRRMAISADAPPNTSSRMLSAMRNDIRRAYGFATVLVSYQDVAVHHGTIYKASGWTPVAVSRPRHRDRAPLRTGTSRKYRSDVNGVAPAASAKIRWQIGCGRQKFISLSPEQILRAKELKPTK